MYKLILLMKRKRGMSKEAFRRHYESSHVPLGVEALPLARRYVRNYLYAYPGGPDGEEELPYDAMTEIWFDSAEDCRHNMALLADRPEQAAIIAADEDKFIDGSKTLWFTSEQAESTPYRGPG